jgi:hypothetical protein
MKPRQFLNYPDMVKRGLIFCLFAVLLVYTSIYPGLTYQINQQQMDKLVNEKSPIENKSKINSSILSFDTKKFTDWAGLTKELLDQKIQKSSMSFNTIKHNLYLAPYFIFQATYGEKASDYYLFSLNTKSGDLVKIHKGYHRRFWVERDRFIFQHTDHFFSCPLGKWNQLQEIQDPVANMDVNKIYFSYESELPKELRAIDWENIHCVFRGSFKNKSQSELLFITGRIPSYKIALLSWENNQMKLIEQLEVGRGKEFGEQLSEEESKDSDNGMVNFRQAIFEDIDGDQRLEILINGVYAAWMYPSNPLVYVDFCEPKSKKKFQLNKIHDLGDAELIRYKNRILYSGDWYNLGDKKKGYGVFAINYYNASGQISLQEIAPIPWEMKEHINQVSNARFHESYYFGPKRKHLSFTSTARNLSDAGKPVVLKSKKLPKLEISPLYNAANPLLTKEEKIYHTKRNDLLQQYVKKLDTGWNPFPGFSIKDVYEEEEILDEKTAYQKWKGIEDIIPIFGKNGLFTVVVVNIQETVNKDYQYLMPFLFLYDSNLNLLDYRACTQNDSMHGPVTIYLPLLHESCIYTEYGVARGSYFTSYAIENGKLNEDLNIYNQGVDFVTIKNQLILHVSINNHYLTTGWDGGNGLGFYSDYFIDPINKQIKDLLFPDYFKLKLDYLYQMYHFFSFHKNPQESFEDQKFEATYFIEQYEKNIFYHELKTKTLDDLQ